MSHAADNRRSFLGYCTNVLMTGILLLLAIPAASYFFAPLFARRRDPLGFQEAGPLSDIPADTWTLRIIEIVQADGWKESRVRHSIWVRRQGEGDKGITVLSPICPHLGCPVNWHPDQKKFICPCHGGIFDSEGRHLSGPPPRGMDYLEFEIRAGRLWVRWQDFKIGVSDRFSVSA
jgi:menaquinol-cytochrome c reductase iron-sulfur subunit